MYKNKDSSSMPAINWSLKHEATAISAYLKKFEETHRAVEVVKPGLLTHRTYSYKGNYLMQLLAVIVTVLI